MTVPQIETILADLRARGVQIKAEDGTLHLRAPRGTLTSEERDALSARKRDLLDVLVAEGKESGTAGTPTTEGEPNLAEDGVWWTDPTSSPMPEAGDWSRQLRESYTEIVCLPPRCCAFARICARLGVCDRRGEGEPCVVAA